MRTRTYRGTDINNNILHSGPINYVKSTLFRLRFHTHAKYVDKSIVYFTHVIHIVLYTIFLDQPVGVLID